MNFQSLLKWKAVRTESQTSIILVIYEEVFHSYSCEYTFMYTHYVILSQPSIIEPLKSLRTNSTSCEMTCTQNNGRIPYLYEAKSVLTQLDKNSTINGTDFSLIAEHLPVIRRSSFSPKNVRQLQFRISASFNFENDIWR